ncbi:MAG: ChbG/HpnK family deacetylase [Lachnospiraceae bacterium]|nr:ChbG/HpnK family deacetylase [Lachnospiraceae bacterium]
MLKLIINADDLGISEDVNEAIAECFRKRFITSTTLMVNMEYADEGVELAKKSGWHERVGLHLNLTSGRPLTDEIKRFKCFCRSDGTFNAAFAKKTFSRLYLSKNEIAAARIEADAQIRKYLSYGLGDRHLDSHHHVHTNSAIWKAIEPLITGYGLRSVRLSRNLYGNMPLLKRVYKKRYNQRLKGMPIMTTDYFGSFKDFEQYRSIIPDKSLVEIMVHPKYNDDRVLVDTERPIDTEKSFLESIKHIQQFY